MPNGPWRKNAPETVSLVLGMVARDCAAADRLECSTRAAYLHDLFLASESARLDGMEASAHTGKVAAFKMYTAWGPNGIGFSLEDPAIGLPVIQKARDLGVKVIVAHKGLPLVRFDAAHNTPSDIVAVSRLFPDMQFVVFHGAWDKNHIEGAYDRSARRGIDTFLRALDDHGVPSNSNVWVDLGTVWREVLRSPDVAAHTV